MRRIYAMRALVDGDSSYRRGDEITEGALYEQADYYAEIGCVRIEVAEDGAQEPQADEADTADDLRELTVSDLRDMAQELEIDGYYSMRKAELIEAIDGVR